MKKKTIKRFIIIFIATAIFLSAAYWITSPKQPQDVLSMNLREHKNLVLHIHPTVEIEILGETQVIPAGIGISDEGMRVIHTHKTDGTLHIEAPVQHQFYLKDFFEIWGETLTNTCIFDYCADEDHTLTVYVNGEEDTRSGDIPFHDKDIVKIVYE